MFVADLKKQKKIQKGRGWEDYKNVWRHTSFGDVLPSKGSTTIPNSSTNWTTSVQTPEPKVLFLVQTTILGLNTMQLF